MGKSIVIFHSMNGVQHCDDGFGAAWVAHRALANQGGAEFVPGIYGQEPPDCTGRSVYILDFSYPRETMLRIGRQAASLVVLDHHKTAQANLAGLTDVLMKDGWPEDGQGQYLGAPYVLFDMEHSGAVLAWQFFFRAGGFGPMPELLKRIEDGDLWRWAYPDSKLVQAALRSYPQDFRTWDDLMGRPVGDLAAEGVAIRRFIDAKIRELMPNVRVIDVAGYRVEAIACPKMFASEVAGELAERGNGPFGVAYEDGATQRTYSLRSRDDFDVSEIARKFGGGGHKNAAGFQVPL